MKSRKGFGRCIVVLLIFVTIKEAEASAWLRKKNHYFFSLTYFFLTANSYFDKYGKEKKLECSYTKHDLIGYGEYGLSDRATLIFKVPLTLITCGEKYNGNLQDIEVGIIGSFVYYDPFVFSLYGKFIIPWNYSTSIEPIIGYGSYAFEVGLLGGYSNKWVFVDSGFGYRKYTDVVLSISSSYLTLGGNIGKGFQLIGTLDFQRTAETNLNIVPNVFVPDSFELLNLYIGPRIRAGNYSLFIGFIKTLYGLNTGKSEGGFLSLWAEF